MSRTTQPKNATKSTMKTVNAAVGRVCALAVLLTVTFGFVGTSGAAASDCNKLFRSGHGYYGCGGIDHAWHYGTWEWVLYFW